MPPVRAVYTGFHFDMSGWPPKRRVLLRGVSPADVTAGALFFDVPAAADQLAREEGFDLLDRLCEVLREGLPPGDFLVEYGAVTPPD